MTISVSVFSAAGRRSMLPASLPEGATIQQALDAAGEGVPPDCEIFLDGNRVSPDSVIPNPAEGATPLITINRKTKGNRFLVWLVSQLRGIVR